MKMSKSLATLDEVANYLNVSRKTVDRLVGSGHLPVFHLKGTSLTRIHWAAVEIYLRSSLSDQSDLVQFIDRTVSEIRDSA